MSGKAWRRAAFGLALLASGDAMAAEHVLPRLVHAEVVALDHLLVYNRFGSFNPYGMIFALRRDVSALDGAQAAEPADCESRIGTEPGTGPLEPGKVRLKDCKRPRPLVLRGAVGDVLEVRVTNLLREHQPDISDTWCNAKQRDAGTAPTRADSRAAFDGQCDEAKNIETEASPEEKADLAAERRGDWPKTRRLSFVVPGLEPVAGPSGTVSPECLGLAGVEPGGSFTCRFRLEREGTHLFSSLAAPAGGEGDGGSLTQGLFGALIVEAAGAEMFRSQVPAAAFEKVWKRWDAASGKPRHARPGAPDYGVAVENAEEDPKRGPASDPAPPFECGGPVQKMPILRLVRDCAGTVPVRGIEHRRAEIVHGDLNAIIVPGPRPAPPGESGADAKTGEDLRTEQRLEREAGLPFREFTVVFHDELKTFYADAFKELDEFGQLSGVRDGFAINYGASGLGAMVAAQRKGIGPAANCPECLWEEFFLESWANGDPALLERYADDPSNVHHSYLNDKAVFRNLHAGKETHVFHLHTHQWFAGNDENRGAYLDSQTIGPQQGFTYRIYHGGLDRHDPRGEPGYAPQSPAGRGHFEAAKGSGNRNRTVGDAIFHCHLYPHFAQGMWALWRVHDVLEDGSRRLPDGQAQTPDGLSTKPSQGGTRRGSVDPVNGTWLGEGAAKGTPIPGLIPVPGEAPPPIPTYTAAAQADSAVTGMPGFPFYIAGIPGHRAPQPPLDMAFQAGSSGVAGGLLDGGLPRHVVTGGVAVPAVATQAEHAALAADPGKRSEHGSKLLARGLALGDVTSEFERLTLHLLPHTGTPLERNAMAFHHDGIRRFSENGTATEAPLDVKRPDGGPAGPQVGGGYRTGTLPMPDGRAPGDGTDRFHVNGAPPAPGAPFADPCGAPSTMEGEPFRRFVGHRAAEPGRPELRDAFVPALFTPAVDALLSGDTAIAPLRGAAPTFVPDPGLIGLRRYAVSAVQFDMTVNRAGWHDPQARIAVLTQKAADWKSQRSARAEPFFFRAFSGECIELRHTNETPKDLDLDDFQLKLPTDTIGQHIHLVKFDVTASDGAGNGFNYEDGTFAPDEILARICAAAKPGGGVIGDGVIGDLADREQECDAIKAAKDAYRDALAAKDPEAIGAALERLKAAQVWNRTDPVSRKKYFQTTVQRWFADPILSNTGDGKASDRTLRTVFTHDHFTPSNIQQHGYYAALLIEPNTHAVQRFRGPEDGASSAEMAEVRPPAHAADAPPKLEEGGPSLVGARANVTALAPARREWEKARSPFDDGDPIHPDTREYALAIADMALLYDGKGQTGPAFDAEAASPSDPKRDPKGMARLVAEAGCLIHGVSGEDVARDADFEAGERIPARRGGLCVRKPEAAPIDEPASKLEEGTPSQIHQGAVLALKIHAKAWRAAYGRPVAPPPRPEAITQKHHDPYLVSYRGEPVPLRIGARGSGGQPFAFRENPCSVPRDARTPGSLPTPDDDGARPHAENHRQIRGQRVGEAGDLANLFRSAWTHEGGIHGHGDPCTPLIEGYGNERLLVRLIQGAQEVQHLFRVEGAPFRRNVDQHFPTARPRLAYASTFLRSRFERCQENRDARDGRPRQFRDWLTGRDGLDGFWNAFGSLAEGCDNLMGVVAAQEIGISEHFEIGGYYRAETPSVPSLRLASRGDATGPTRERNILRNNSGTNPTIHPETVGVSDDRQVLDYLYGFGSADAIWNGASGLIRIYDGPDSGDLGRCLLDPTKAGECLAAPGGRIGDRLDPAAGAVARARRNAGTAARMSAAPAEAAPTLAAAQTLACPSGAPQVGAVMVAVRAGEVHGKHWGALPGMPYDPDKRLYDPDALLIVGLSLAETAPGRDAATVHDVLAAGIPERRDLIEIVRKKLDGAEHPHPFVLRAMAGDCVTVLMVNALRPKPGRDEDIRDIPGDALLPNIVPLNGDPLQSGGSGRELRSSSRVVFTLPAGLTSPRAGVAFPFGINQAPALDSEDEAGGSRPGGSGRRILPARSSRATTFYAGSLFVDAEKLVGQLTGNLWTFRLGPPPGRTIVAKPRDRIAGCASPEVETALLGVLFCIGWQDGLPGEIPLDFATGATGEKAENAGKVAWSLIDHLKEPTREASFLKKVPYAFGALPIRVAGDTFGHSAHGLMGTLIIEPKNDESPPFPDRTRIELKDAKGDPLPPEEQIQFESVAGTWSEKGVLIEQPKIEPCRTKDKTKESCSEPIPAARIREHTLLWQDGLNLWSRTWSRGETSTRPDPVEWGYDSGIDKPWDPALPSWLRGYPGHPLPDCLVCDDSYDRGEKGVSYRSAPFARRLAGWSNPLWLGLTHYSKDETNLNAFEFPSDFFDARTKPLPTPTLLAHPGEQVAIRVAHPAGRARQRAFLLLGHGYEDLLPGFGSGHAGLLGPGKALTASVCAARETGSFLYRDGPQPIFAGGVFGHLDVRPAPDGTPETDRADQCGR